MLKIIGKLTVPYTPPSHITPTPPPPLPLWFRWDCKDVGEVARKGGTQEDAARIQKEVEGWFFNQ